MNGKARRRIKRILLLFTGLYVAGGVVLFFIQDLLLFHPKQVAINYQYSFEIPFKELNIQIGNHNLSIIQFQSAQPKKGLVLFYHGNMKNVEHYSKYPPFFLRNGYDVWMIDYPGFGKTTGKRTEKAMNEQALMMFDRAVQTIKSDSVIIYGKSIGTGVAAYVAANRHCRNLILETPYYSINDLARHYFPIYPVVPMTRYSFPIFAYLKEVQSPISFIHGTKDETIPYHQALKLKKEKPSIELITIEGGKHNNLASFSLFQKKIDSLLSNEL